MCKNSNSVTSNVTTRLLLKLYELNNTSDKAYDLSNLWQFYSDHKPFGPLNGGLQMIDELTKVHQLITDGLIDYSPDNPAEPLKDKAFFKDSKGHIIMNFESPLFTSHFVVITQKGIEYVESLKNQQ